MMRITLDRLRRGQRVLLCENRLTGPLRERLGDLGLIPGTEIGCLCRLPWGSPVLLDVRRTCLALRRTDLRHLVGEVIPRH